MSRQLLDLLYKSFDAKLSEAEQRMLEKGLADSDMLRKEKGRIEQIRNKIAGTAQHSFPKGFVERVMDRIPVQHLETDTDIFFKSLVSVFRPVAIAALVLIGVFITYNMAATEDISLKGAYAISDVSVEDAFDPIVDLATE
jgi:hypothetical protein